MDGALLIDKHAGPSSFGVIEALKKTAYAWNEGRGGKPKDLPPELRKMGHGGTLDPFATGLLIVCIGRGVKLSRYFLGSEKSYEATLKFGETTLPGDSTAEISERNDRVPGSLDELRATAERFCAQAYLQTPPMHSAKKKNGRPLYELAREGIEIEREPKLCLLRDFRFEAYDPPFARFSVSCSSGTYIRTLAQDFARLLGSVGMLTALKRTRSGAFSVAQAMSIDAIAEALRAGANWTDLSCFVPFDRLLEGYPRADATESEAVSLAHGRQNALFSILQRAPASDSNPLHKNALAIYREGKLLAIARQDSGIWGLERVFGAD